MKRKTPLVETASRTAATPDTPIHLPSRYCHGRTGHIRQMVRSRCSKATLAVERKTTSTAMIMKAAGAVPEF